jgi:hypothetical protein
LTNQNYSNVDKDDIVGNILYSTITAYFAVLDVSDETLAKTMGVIRYRAPSVGMFSVSLNVRSVFGIPTNASSDGLIMDVDRLMQAVFSKDGAMDKVKQYMSVSGSTSSALEHSVPEQIYSASNLSTNSISAIKAIQLANDQGIPIYTATKDNIGTILPQLSVDSQAISDIVNAVNAGKMVTVQKSNINYNSWNGCGYIIVNPDTGAGAYMISGGMSGSNTNIDKNSWGVFDTVFLIVDLKFWAMGLSMQKSSPLLDIVSKKIGFFGVLVSFINDINQAFNDPNLTTAQKWAIGLALVGFACAAAALVLASGGLLGIIGGIFITLILNWLKESLIQEIKDPVPLF